MKLRKRILAGVPAALAALVLSTVPANASTLLSERFERLSTAGTWADGSTHGQWGSMFDGYGYVGIDEVGDGNKVLTLRPKASSEASETHAALVTSRAVYDDIEFSLEAKTVRQLRSSHPNPWESAWAIWHYGDNTHFYYLALKPNGWELGKADPAYPGAQRFLATGSSPSFPIGSWSRIRVRQVGATMSVWADGQLLTRFTDRERPYLGGRVGFYNEDAKTRFDDVVVSAP